MKKQIFHIITPYVHNPSHRGAPYTLDNSHWMNQGELIETLVKLHMGFKPGKDASTAYDLGSDIPEIKASVKSGKATLVNFFLGNTPIEILDTYFKNVHSETFIWGVIEENLLTAYTMNPEEFRTFCETWSYMNERKVLRFKTSSKKMISWLEEKVG